MRMRRDELADFLRRRREALDPRDVGLHSHGRRRTPGLRREEVAMLATMSTDYYVRLEQGRSPQPSPQLLAALGRALRLSCDELHHLYLLAGQTPPLGPDATSRHVTPAVLHIMDRLVDTPVQVIDDLGNLIAQNPVADALFGCAHPADGEQRNIIRRWFTDPLLRAPFTADEIACLSRSHAADLRAAYTRRLALGADAEASELVETLLSESAEFAELWEQHEVEVRLTGTMKVDHPDVGRIELDVQTLTSPASDGQRIMIFTPPPCSDARSLLEVLSVIGSQRFGPAHDPVRTEQVPAPVTQPPTP
ncbi:helix-turn-helix transcriptional regulator [Enemella evansiae]|uniref:helix-turn-helix transcriptional regulator n=1 Tax=Enemella evansiae TaxID=2016499 RepID=UPI001E32385F|nr:helix-turn-helix transcriptional regulator [Enemella evansiae]